MSTNEDEWEQRTLACIADELADSAPELTSVLTVYNRRAPASRALAPDVRAPAPDVTGAISPSG